MSLINDALKRVRQQSGGVPPARMPVVVPARSKTGLGLWILPVIIILLFVAAGVLMVLALSHRATGSNPAPPSTPVNVAAPAVVTAPIRSSTPSNPPVVAVPVVPAPVQTTAVVATVDTGKHIPRLQGIFYDPVHPQAIINGRTFRLGDVVDKYRVKTISKTSITLIDAQGTESVIPLGQ